MKVVEQEWISGSPFCGTYGNFTWLGEQQAASTDYAAKLVEAPRPLDDEDFMPISFVLCWGGLCDPLQVCGN